MRPWILAETNYEYTKNHAYEVAVLPLGATEPHNLHLPYSTDTLEANAIGERVCQAAHERGARVVLLPTIPYGTETNMRELPLAMNIDPATLYQVVSDLIASCVKSGVRKILLLNSHGGNELKPLLRHLAGKTPAQVFVCDWFKSLDGVYEEIFSQPEDHAGEMETSLALAYFPHLVAHTEEGGLTADAGATAKTRFEAVNRGWVGMTRPWHLLTTNSGSGNPHAATKEKGERVMQVLVERLSAFLAELSEAEIDERFPY